jgi:probable rRNA maturation factor
VICGDTLSRRVNNEYRNKDYPPNVLSFPLTKDEGEVFINIRKATREAPRFDTTTQKHIAHLFVHGCLHLKGMDHSDEMEAMEDTILKSFKLD